MVTNSITFDALGALPTATPLLLDAVPPACLAASKRLPKSIALPVVSILTKSIVSTSDGVLPPKNNPRVPPVCCCGDVPNIPVH